MKLSKEALKYIKKELYRKDPKDKDVLIYGLNCKNPVTRLIKKIVSLWEEYKNEQRERID